MMQMQTFVLPRALLASVAAALLAGCAAVGPASSSPEETVQDRANARWAALLKGDSAKAYGYLTPGYRAVHDEATYRKRRGSAVKWTGAEVVDVRCPEATKCLAKVRIEAKPFLGRKFGDTIVTHVEETWLLEDGRWWLFERL
ncbi:hypothetical protein DFR36_10994 [Melaminivora alkalimesophila]|uniref:Nuclear transport factor 2 family protein n=2 Tax=Melaminivora alkalimesophila TaxID=1165852 RepID=A0A317RCT4_9BURK|nr:hypothetical protein [Melaminivora alkalimesophila]PWW43742.1 hypothetical protein DFR36_10994 [Melaminivora alkalimesophila]